MRAPRGGWRIAAFCMLMSLALASPMPPIVDSATSGLADGVTRVRGARRALRTAAIGHLRGGQPIAAWQVENEPLDAAGPHRWRISAEFLAEEIALVRRLDADRQRPVVVNTFVDTQP